MMIKTCVHCSNEFQITTIRHTHQRFCSRYCQKANHKKVNRERYNEQSRLWNQKNPEKRAKSSSDFMKRNREYYTQYASLRSRYVLQAKPTWVDDTKLLEFYRLAKELGLEVDHIIPIKHDKVCGLHVPWNLQLLTRSENARKGNKFDGDVVTKILED